MKGIKTVGIVHDPANTGHYVEKALNVAGKFGLNLLIKETRNAADAPILMKMMEDKVDAFWMLPDVTVISPETVEFLIQQCCS